MTAFYVMGTSTAPLTEKWILAHIYLQHIHIKGYDIKVLFERSGVAMDADKINAKKRSMICFWALFAFSAVRILLNALVNTYPNDYTVDMIRNAYVVIVIGATFCVVYPFGFAYFYKRWVKKATFTNETFSMLCGLFATVFIYSFIFQILSGKSLAETDGYYKTSAFLGIFTFSFLDNKFSPKIQQEQ